MQSDKRKLVLATLWMGVLVTGPPRAARSLSFDFDYRMDTSGFFDAAIRRERLGQAGALLADAFSNNLLPIVPGGERALDRALRRAQ